MAASIFLFSGPCGCGKSTLADAFARKLDSQAYLIHGDDFHAGFVEPADASVPRIAWKDILRFNWDCILDVSRKALELNLDVVIDYVVEDELPLVKSLAEEFGAALYYIVLTASQDTLCKRLQERGDAWLIDRSLFLKAKLDAMPENQAHLFDITALSVEQEVKLLEMKKYLL